MQNFINQIAAVVSLKVESTLKGNVFTRTNTFFLVSLSIFFGLMIKILEHKTAVTPKINHHLETEIPLSFNGPSDCYLSDPADSGYTNRQRISFLKTLAEYDRATIEKMKNQLQTLNSSNKALKEEGDKLKEIADIKQSYCDQLKQHLMGVGELFTLITFIKNLHSPR